MKLPTIFYRPRQTLKCDAVGCSYVEPTELFEALIDKPCPLCGASLLTREDYLAGVELMKLVTPFASKEQVPQSGLFNRQVSLNPHDGDLTVRFSAVAREDEAL